MIFKTFEAWDADENVTIYNGSSVREMYTEMYDYISYQSHMDSSILEKYDSLVDVPRKEFEEIGIKIFINNG